MPEYIGLYKYIDENGVVHLLYPVTRTDAIDAVANLPMGGFKVTGLGTPEEDGDAVPLGYANQNFAPAGYGLGKTAQGTYIAAASDLDNIRKNGWYALWADYNITIAGYADSFFTLEVSMFDENYGKQTIHFQTGYAVTRIKRDGVWYEWEWLNPPMVLGVEYRTTERHNGTVVYTKLINCGTLTHGGTVTLDTAISVIRFAARATNGVAYPFQNNNSPYYRQVIISSGSLMMLCGSTAAGTDTVYCQIWYTK